MDVILILALVLAVVATVLAFIYIVPAKRRDRLNKFGRFLHDTANFKYLIVEKILQACYILATVYVILAGFFMLFYVKEGYQSRYYSYPDEWYGKYGIILILLGPIAIRLAYEFAMMAILLVKNVIQINSKLKAADSEEAHKHTPVFTAPAANQPQQRSFCSHCGSVIYGNGRCPNCGR